jgi:hypothetical protein
MAQVCGHWEERGSVTSLVAATVHSDGGSPASRRPLVRLLGLVPAALLLSGLFSVWAGPLAAPVAAAAPAGGEFSLALKSDGTVVTWGRNASNPPAGLTGVTAIAAGEQHCLALESDGTVVAWGAEYGGGIDVPAGLSGVTAIAAGNLFSLALKSDGTIVAWGDDTHSQTNVPAGLTGVTAISAGRYHSLALKSDGTIVAWGRFASSPPDGLSGVTAIAAGESHSLALYTAADVLVTSGMTTPRMADSTGSIRVTALDGPASASIAIAAPSISRTRMQPPACLRTTPSPQPTTVPTSSSRT